MITDATDGDPTEGNGSTSTPRTVAEVVAALTGDGERQLAAGLLAAMAAGNGSDVLLLLADERVAEFPAAVLLALASVAGLAAPTLLGPEAVAELRRIALAAGRQHARAAHLHAIVPTVDRDELKRFDTW